MDLILPLPIFSHNENQWLRCDDLKVSKTTINDVLKQSKEDGYIFIYSCSNFENATS